MNSGYGGAQREMHTKDIKQNFVYLGPHEQIIEIGDEKHMSGIPRGRRCTIMDDSTRVCRHKIQSLLWEAFKR